MASLITNLSRTFRTQKRHKGLSLISITSIVLGHAVFFLIISYAWYEKSFDRFHKNADQVYRITYSRFDQNTLQYNTANSFFPTGSYLKQNCAAVADYTTMARNYNITIASVNINRPFFFNEDKAYYAQSSFFNVFSFPVIKGNTKDLDLPNKVFITQAMAKRYFGHQDPMGQTLRVNGKADYEVAGIMKDVPDNTHLKFNFLFSMQTHVNNILKKGLDITSHWYANDLFYTYIQLKSGANPKAVAQILPLMVQKNYGDKLAAAKQQDVFAIGPLTGIHLYSNLEWETEKPGNGQAINILIGFAIFILLITWVNYINLVSSQAVDRAREVGIRKTLGGSKRSVLLQLFSEIAAVNLFSIVIAAIGLTITYLVTPGPLVLFPAGVYQSVGFWLVILSVIVIGTLVTGLVPATLIARFNPISVAKGKLVVTGTSLFLRKSLIAFQFIISFILITGALIIYDQGMFLTKKSRGLDHTSVLSVKFPKILAGNDNSESASYAFKQQLKGLKWIKDVTSATDLPEKEIETFGSMYRPQLGESDRKDYFRIGADDNYFNFFKIKLVAGRLFYSDMAAEKPSVILNESAVLKLGYQSAAEAIGKVVKFNPDDEKTIVGVVNDFNYRSVKVKPVATMFNYQKKGAYFAIKLNQGDVDMQLRLSELNNLYNKLFPGNPFEYVFLDDAMKQDLATDLNFARIFGAFSIISIIISMIGLLGLVIVDLNQRLKELSIRKVVGASFKHIMALVIQKFSLPLAIALLVGIPLAAVGFTNWINHNYIYHIQVNAFYFIIPALLLPLLAALVIIAQVVRVNRQKTVAFLK